MPALDLRPVMFVAEVKLFREAVTRLLSDQPNVVVIGSYSGVSELITAPPQSIDTILIEAAQIRSAETVAAVRSRFYSPRLLAIGLASRESLLTCAQAGVDGLVGADAGFDTLLGTLFNNRATVTKPALLTSAMWFCDSGTGECPADRDLLTPREWEILSLINDGLSNKQIAMHLRIRVTTVKNHVHSLLAKLRVGRRSAAAAEFRRRSHQFGAFASRSFGLVNSDQADPFQRLRDDARSISHFPLPSLRVTGSKM